MSLDLFLQDFSDTPRDRRALVEATLAPLLDARRENIITDDGSAAIFGASDVPLEGLMFNHIDGALAWEAIFRVAAAGDWAVLPVGGAVCVPSPHLVGTIPIELADEGVVVVTSDAELRSAITS